MDEPDETAPVGDETRAFQAFYLGRDETPRQGRWYRLLIGWWRRR
ncbi:MAG TPA: hypothetical protein VFN60_07600 [Acidimicrobiales bacterium]|jgi:hypothetical protein|nr:hypothetical protein [Acidimicrobiales bacterium]